MTAEPFVCERDGVATRLTCAGCQAPICPSCMVRTPVGYKCPACVGVGPARRRRVAGLAVPAAVVAIVAGLAAVTLLRPSGRHPAAAVPASAAAPAPAPTPQPMMGEDTGDGQLGFVVDDISCGATDMVAGGVTRTAQGKFCRLKLTVRNKSGGPATFLGRFQYLLDAQSKSYGPDLGLTQAVAENGNRDLSQLVVNPGISVPVVLVYDVPPAVDPMQAKLRGTGTSRFGVDVRLQRRTG